MRLNKRQYLTLQAMGIPAWQEKPGTGSSESTLAPDDALPEVIDTAVPVQIEKTAASLVRDKSQDLPDFSACDWPSLESMVRSCELCELSRTRSQTVFGVGNKQADWMLIGEAPGAEEDRQGEPFVGRAGQLLNRMLTAIGLQRQQVYIANIVKCRPPDNRDPHVDEIRHCSAYLKRQIELVSPRVILVLGRVAAHSLLGTDEALGRLRGAPHIYEDTGIPVIVTYHPAYLLRKPVDKRKSWEDLKLAATLVTAKS
jgi:DNA polymerase